MQLLHFVKPRLAPCQQTVADVYFGQMTLPSSEPVAKRILVVDDDAAVLRATRTVLGREGWSVTTAGGGHEAIAQLGEGAFDIVISDINMPGYGGLQVVRSVRECDADVPVILVTGDPSLESSIRALEYGAFRYLVKPVMTHELVEAVRQGFCLHDLARLKRRALDIGAAGGEHRLGELTALDVRFSSALEKSWMAYQPIIAWRERRVFGYEALLRSDDTLMNNPGDILDAAERLGRIHELGRAVRSQVARAALSPVGLVTKFFVNLHSLDLNDDQLYSVKSPLSTVADRVVLEITERASLHAVSDATRKVRGLKDLGFALAIDDLGAGYAGLNSFTLLEPRLVKLDMSLVRGIDGDPMRQQIVRSMRSLCDDLGMLVVAEGVETVAERDELVALGCDLFQGYLFGRPARELRSPVEI
jgi:EAL domain-containing protein (putative c-di-GMP-specific phosphodiesterase class I)/CheY-like chemotaxis protein